MEFEQVLLTRRSVRTFTGEKPTPEEMDALLLAARSAPVGRGQFDRYRIHVVEDPAFLAELDTLHGELTDRRGQKHLFGAPVLFIISTVLPGNRLDNVYYSSAAIVAEHIHLQATALGLGSCLIWGAIRSLNERPAFVSRLDLPVGFSPVCAVCVGKTEAALPVRNVPENKIETVFIK